MNKLIIFLLAILSIKLSAQTESRVEITEDGFILSIEETETGFFQIQKGEFIIKDYYSSTNYSKPGEYKLPSQTLLIALPPESKPLISVLSFDEIKHLRTIPQLNPKLLKINDSTIVEDYSEVYYQQNQFQSNEIIELEGFGWFRDYYCAQVKINTHFFNESDNSIIERKNIRIKINTGNSGSRLSYSQKFHSEIEKNIIYNYEISESIKANPVYNIADSTGNWINFDADYLKLGTAEDGLYRVTKSDLEAAGIITSSINPKTFQLYESGKEIPIFVSGEDDDVFDDQDYIEFFGTINYSKNDHRTINSSSQEYNEYLNRFTDTTFYFLTWSITGGKRIPVLNTTTIAADTLEYYKSFEHIENNRVYFSANINELENQYPNWNKNKTWYYSQTVWLYSGTTRNYSFNAPDLIPGKTAKFYYKAVSGGSNVSVNSHNVAMSVNGGFLDSAVVNRNEQVLLSGSISSNILTESGNTLSVRNYSNGTNPNFLAVDWYEIEYPRKLKLNNNSLHFVIDDDVSSSIRTIRIENAALQQYAIYKVRPYVKKITNAQISNNIILFTDTVAAGDAYIAAAPAETIKPVFYYKKQFSDLRSVTAQKDYLAITHPVFIDASQNYLSVIASLYNTETELINVQDIFDEFGYGYPVPEAIKNYLAVTFQNRQSPKPEYLTIIGDANYDYKDYFFNATGVKGGRNFVPSFGSPVSDNWFVIWNDSSALIPQMKVGRIPINQPAELEYYASKIENNFNARFDEFNKRYLFFSGGIATDTLELYQLRTTNEFVINNYIKPAPIKGAFSHFYKTSDPLTDFGPYSPEEISSAIKNGGVFISYLGHSGTATWDNSISETDQLINDVNRNPLITDFGCSTNRFGEPDIVSFGERFLLRNTGQAIGYVGNSSLGFTSTAYTVPRYFYESIINSGNKEIGDAFLMAKMKMYQNLGSATSYRIFALTNTLIGDPVVRIGIPSKPNLKISLNDIKLSENYPTNALDSIKAVISINNFGTVTADSFSVSVIHKFNQQIINTYLIRLLLPDFKDSLIIFPNILDKPGLHTLEIKLDVNTEIDEIYKDDNELNYTFVVFSNEVRDLIENRIENSKLSSITLLNPFINEEENISFLYQISEDEFFTNAVTNTINSDTFFTKINFGTLDPDKRYYFRYKLNSAGSEYSLPKSFINTSGNSYLLSDSIAFVNQNLTDLDYSEGSLKITDREENISVTSAGFFAGASCVIAKNGINLLSNTFFAGMGIVVFDPLTLEIDTTAWFNLFNNPTNMQALVALIDSIPEGKTVAMGVADDAANNISANLKNAIKTLGSTKIDSLAFRGSWAIISRKGALPGDVIEVVKGPYDGIVIIDTTYSIPRFSGLIETNVVGPVKKWNNLHSQYSVPGSSGIQFTLIGVTDSGEGDTLFTASNPSGTIALSFVNAEAYPYLKLSYELNADIDGVTPEIFSAGISYEQLPETGINFQTVYFESDTVFIGDEAKLYFNVFNASRTEADSFSVLVTMINENSTVDTLVSHFIEGLSGESSLNLTIDYRTKGADRLKRFVVNVDPENMLREFYKDNNIFSRTLVVIPDSTVPTLKISFDGEDIFDGDFISTAPDIRIEISDESNIPFTDTSLVKVFLNEAEVFENLSYSFYPENPKLVVTYTPVLESGDYLLRVTARDPGGNFADSVSGVKYFRVSDELKMMDVYNYPNPFTDGTYFTFKLTRIPDEIKIRIFTIAGRLIKEIQLPASELSYDFNKIYWDGKDEDGDFVSNGTYLYKIILTSAEKTESVIQKLSKAK